MNARGQAIVEMALAFPITCLLLLAVAGTGIYLLAAQEQAASTSTIALWAAAHPTADAATFADFAARVGPCDGARVTYSPNLATVTLSCPTVQLLPMLPSSVVTTAAAYTADPSTAP